jgi:hypothetical protein
VIRPDNVIDQFFVPGLTATHPVASLSPTEYQVKASGVTSVRR